MIKSFIQPAPGDCTFVNTVCKITSRRSLEVAVAVFTTGVAWVLDSWTTLDFGGSVGVLCGGGGSSFGLGKGFDVGQIDWWCFPRHRLQLFVGSH